MKALPPGKDLPESSPPASISPLWWCLIGLGMGAFIVYTLVKATPAGPQDTVARLERALAQYREASATKIASIYKPDFGSQTTSVRVKDQTPVEPVKSVQPALVGPVSPFAPGTLVQPPGLAGDLHPQPLPMPVNDPKTPSPIDVMDTPCDLAIMRVASANPAAKADEVRALALKYRGHTQAFQEVVGNETLLEKEGLLVFIPSDRGKDFESDVKGLGGQVEDRWRGPASARSAEIERSQRTLLAKLLTQRELMLKDFMEDAPSVKDIDGRIETIRAAFRNLRPQRPVAKMSAYRITLDEGR